MIGRLSLFLLQMKHVALIIFCCFFWFDVFAQIPKAVEDDLFKTLSKIDYWDNKKSNDTISGVSDSLESANDQFEKKLRYNIARYPSSISQSLKRLGGIVSGDDSFAIFSWDTMMGGTQHVFETFILYRSGRRTNFVEDTTTDSDGYVYAYDKLFTLKVGSKKYYLATYYGIFSLHSRGEGIRIFAIEDGKLNTKVKLIKTRSGLTNKLYYTYNQNLTNSDIMSETTIEYDPGSKTISFPLVSENGRITDSGITYKFNGQYFEKVKS